MGKSYPWLPKHLPRRWPYTAHRDGWYRWYKGDSRYVCGTRTAIDEVDDRWVEKKKLIDAKLRDVKVAQAASGAPKTIRAAASDYYIFLDYRVKTGQPDPMSEITAADYKRIINEFGRAVGPDRSLEDLAQQDFSAHAKAFAENAPSTLARVVAVVQAFLRWCVDEGILAELPQWGRYFAKPSLQHHRDQRLLSEKSYEPAHLRRVWARARVEEKCWIILGVCGAMDNSDISHLTVDVLDRKAGVIDYRRRKRGKIRRVMPMPPLFWELLEQYERAAPASAEHADRVFLTPTGLPLQRIVTTGTAKTATIDYVAMRWVRLLIQSGLRAKLPSRRKLGRKTIADEPQRTRRTKAKGHSGGQGFRGLRTTFPNLAPPGFRDEVELVMGHKTGIVLLEHYLERFGMARLRELVDHVFHSVFPLVSSVAAADPDPFTSAPQQDASTGPRFDSRDAA